MGLFLVRCGIDVLNCRSGASQCSVVHLRWLVSLGNRCAVPLSAYSPLAPQTRTTEQMSHTDSVLLQEVTVGWINGLV